MAIAEHVRGMLAAAGLDLATAATCPQPPRMPNLGEAFTRPYQDAERIAADPAYGTVVCFCERVTRRRAPRRLRLDHPAGRPRRAASPDPRDERPLPRLLLRCPRASHLRWISLQRINVRHHRRAAGDTPMNTQVTADVAIIGGGPAGLTAATALANGRLVESPSAGA